jgi:hypothetical protein
VKRYKRAIICLPDCYGRQRVEMNIYKQKSEHTPFPITRYFIKWEGEWQRVIYRPEYVEWEFIHEN